MQGARSSSPEEGERKREQMLRHLAEGLGIAESCRRVGWTENAYRYHRRVRPMWGAECDAVRAAARGGAVMPELHVGFPEKVARFFPDRRPHMAHQLRIVDELKGLGPRDVLMVNIWPEAGKLLSLDTPIPTPSGWTTMCEIRRGDEVYAGDGTVTVVTGVSETQLDDTYRITFSDGSTVTAGGSHQWIVRSRKRGSYPSAAERAELADIAQWFPSGNNRPARRSTTAEMFDAGVFDGDRPNHAIPVPGALDGKRLRHLVDPYLLGVWLGDGHTKAGRITTADIDDMEGAAIAAGYSTRCTPERNHWTLQVYGLVTDLRKIGVYGDKHIPAAYLRGAAEQRWALLEGLMDTDGGCDERGRCEFTTTKAALHDGFCELLRSLGIKFSTSEGRSTLNGKDCGPKWRVQFVPRRYVFRLARKAQRQRPAVPNDRDRWRKITNIERVPPTPMRCISVEHPSHTYVFGHQMLVTHNTATIEDYLCLEIADDPSLRVRYVSEASDLSKRIVGTVKRRFTDESEYPEFIRKYGPFYTKGQEKEGRPWTTEQITVQRNPGTERDRNLVASSWTSAVYGSRIDLLILDDLCSQRNYNQSQEIFSRIRGTFFNRGLLMKTIIVGTRIGPGDFYERMLDAGLVTRHVNIRAADTEGNPTVPAFWDVDMHHDGGACCKQLRPCPRDGSKVTPREFMELMRFDSGEETWWASYMQTPLANELTTFSEYIDRCLDHDRLIGQSAA